MNKVKQLKPQTKSSIQQPNNNHKNLTSNAHKQIKRNLKENKSLKQNQISKHHKKHKAITNIKTPNQNKFKQ